MIEPDDVLALVTEDKIQESITIIQRDIKLQRPDVPRVIKKIIEHVIDVIGEDLPSLIPPILYCDCTTPITIDILRSGSCPNCMRGIYVLLERMD